jgi:hypothetical protein
MHRGAPKGLNRVRAGAWGAAAFSLGLLLLAGAPVHGQTPPAAASLPAPPPLPGFVPPYEITRIVRAAGFDPLAPPLREGTTYVVRATDFRGILMRVVVDAQSGAIRAVNRIVAGPGPYGQLGMLPPPYGAPSPNGPPEFGLPEIAPYEESAAPPAPAPAAIRPATHPLVAEPPPLPRPRPAELASRKTADDAKSGAQSGIRSGAKPGVVTAPAAPPLAPNKPPAPAPMNE